MSESDYQPSDKEAFERMMRFMGNCETVDDLRAAVLLYLFDMSYPRVDLLMAEKLTRKAKGWH